MIIDSSHPAAPATRTDGSALVQLSLQPPSREAGATSAEPFVRMAGAAGWLLSIITSHAPEDGCNRCAPAIADGCNGCGPAILPKMAAI